VIGPDVGLCSLNLFPSTLIYAANRRKVHWRVAIFYFDIDSRSCLWQLTQLMVS
jgi:hypothetical protein